MNTSISPGLYQHLKQTLLACDAFQTDNQLRAIFVNARLDPWRNAVPQAGNPQDRVVQTIATLLGQWNNDQQNALYLLLCILHDTTDPGNALYCQLIELAEELKHELSPQPSPMSSIKVEPPPRLPSLPTTASIPFTNREDELQTLLDFQSPPYSLVDAPAGYGKTELLKRLQSQFEERGWLCAYTAIEGYSTLEKVVTTLATQLGVAHLVNHRLLPSEQLGSALVRYWRPDVPNITGLILLIDFDKKPDLKLFKEIVDEFIPATQNNLKALECFQKGEKKFRVVLAGRYLAASKEAKPKGLRLKSVVLKPFDYEVICESARQYLKNYAEEVISQIAGHLIYLTGGHPRCVAQTLKMYLDEGLLPDLFISNFSHDIWENIVSPAINAIVDGLPMDSPDFYKMVCNRFSILRYADYAILDDITTQDTLREVQSGYELEAKLLATYLFDREGRLIHDDIIRRLLAIRLRQDPSGNFRELCCQARDMCASRMQNSAVQGPEIWAIEYLFQSLQQYAPLIQDTKQRDLARHAFFENDVPNALYLLTKGRNLSPQEWQGEINVLKDKMQTDWEFQFVVNYYLRESQYTDGPYQQLLEQIDQFLA